MRKILDVLVIIGCLFGLAHADGSGSAVSLDAGIAIDAGSGSAVITVPVTSGVAAGPIVIAPPINPVADPSGYIAQLSGAKSSGWGVLLLVLVFGLCEILAKAGASVPALAWLGKGRLSIVIGGGVAVGAAAIAALSSSGTWVAAGYAAVGAVLLYLHPAAKDVAIQQVAKASSVVALVLFFAVAGCGPNQPGPVVVNNVIDCTGANLGPVAALLADFRAKISGGSSWTQIEADAKKAGSAIGGCALAELVQEYLGGKGAPAIGDSHAARAALEDFRATAASGASFKTAAGNL